MARILIVDDDKDILKIADALLTRMGHDSRTTTNAARALEMLSSSTFDLLITDANMPEYTGFELIKTIKKQNVCTNLSIAMLTGSRDKVNLEKAIALGVDDYIVKPLDPTRFVEKVTKLLTKKPPVEKTLIEFSPLVKEAKVKVTTGGHISGISEAGVVFHSPVPFPKGTMLQIESEIFMKINVVCPAMRVYQCVESDEDYEVSLVFVGADERVIEKIRAWAYKENSKRKNIVA